MQLTENPRCAHCHSKYTVKNGKTYYGKQNHKCKTCKRQFVEQVLDPVENFKEELVADLLLERISLRGVCRVLQHSMSWVYARMYKLWDQLPDYLPIGKLENSQIELYCVEADEMWSFVGAKDCKEWIWLAIQRRTKLVVGYHIGGRDEEGALGLLLSLPADIEDSMLVFTDDFPSYGKVFPKGQLQQEGKKNTTFIERFNCTLRQRCSRLVRLSLSFSKKWTNHYLAIKYFIVNYNLDIFAKNPSLY